MKNKIASVIVSGIVLVIISLLSFTYANTKSPAFTVSYFFLLLAAVIQLIPVFFSRPKDDTAYSTFMFTVSLMYLVMQAALSILGYTILRSSKTTILIFSIIIICIYFAVMLNFHLFASRGENSRRNEKEKVAFIDNIVCKLELCRSIITDNELNYLLNDNIDGLKYSDIMSPDNASDVETQIKESVQQIEKFVNCNRLNDAKNECQQLKKLIQERKNICKLYK